MHESAWHQDELLIGSASSMMKRKPRIFLAALLGALLAGASGVKLHAASPVAEANPASAYLFTSFRDADQKYLRFLYSSDGYHWTNVPGTFLEANVGTNKQFRDPSLLRGPDGMFHLVWTAGWHNEQGFGCANSKDLIHWSEQKFVPVMTNEPATVNVWAPELFYDAPADRSSSPGLRRFPDAFPTNWKSTITITGCISRRRVISKTFAPAKLFFDPASA